MNTTSNHRPKPRLVNQYRLRGTYIRILDESPNDHEEYTFILANSTAGLDSESAYRMSDFTDLYRILKIAARDAALDGSASLMEVELLCRDALELGIQDVD